MKLQPRDQLVEAAVAGVTAGGIAVGFTALIRLGSSLGDTLGFLGGVVGAGLAVIGALWVEDRRRNANRRREAAMILFDLRFNRDALSSELITLREMSDEQSLEMRHSALAVCAIISNAGDVPRAALSHGSTLGLNELMRLQKIVGLSDFVKSGVAGDDEEIDREATLMAGDTAISMIDCAIEEVILAR